MSGDVAVRSARIAGRSWVNLRRRISRPEQRRDVAVKLGGAEWLGDLLAPSVAVVGRRWPGSVPVIELHEGDLAPFVQPLHANPVRRRWPQGAPPEFEQRGREASLDHAHLAPIGSTTDRSDPWMRDHSVYRAAHRISADDVIDDEMRRIGLPFAERRRDVTVVCVTMRPEHVRDVIDNYDRQIGVDKRLVVVTNADGFERTSLSDLVADRTDISVIETDPSMSLGDCLNTAIDLTTTRYLAKFDDDDEYGANFLADSLIAHSFANAAVVGKHCYFGYLAEDDRTIVRFPGREFTYTPYLAGGSLVIDLERTGRLRFPSISIGEDQGFIAACHRRGLSTFAADRFNFVQVRDGRNTWQPPLLHYLAKSVTVGDGRRTELVHV